MYPDRGKGIKRQRKKHKDHSCASREISRPSRNQTWRCQYWAERPNDNPTLVYGFLARKDIIIKSQILYRTCVNTHKKINLIVVKKTIRLPKNRYLI